MMAKIVLGTLAIVIVTLATFGILGQMSRQPTKAVNKLNDTLYGFDVGAACCCPGSFVFRSWCG